jgi:uncharacterized protein (TIGR03086 family)
MTSDISKSYAAACEQAARVIQGIRPEQLDAATPCPDWDTRALLNHFVGSSLMMATCGRRGTIAGATSGPEAVAAMGDLVGDDPVSAYASASAEARTVFTDDDALSSVWKLPFGDIPGAAALQIHFMETVGHTWDLAKATNQLNSLDPDLAVSALQVAQNVIQPAFRSETGDPFAAPVEVAANASAYDRYAAFLGRNP